MTGGDFGSEMRFDWSLLFQSEVVGKRMKKECRCSWNVVLSLTEAKHGVGGIRVRIEKLDHHKSRTWDSWTSLKDGFCL